MSAPAGPLLRRRPVFFDPPVDGNDPADRNLASGRGAPFAWLARAASRPGVGCSMPAVPHGWVGDAEVPVPAGRRPAIEADPHGASRGERATSGRPTTGARRGATSTPVTSGHGQVPDLSTSHDPR